MAAPLVPALVPGARVDGFVVERVLGRNAGTILYHSRDAASGQSFVLREFAPAGLAERRPDGSLAAAPGAETTLAASIARFLADSARGATLQHAALLRSIRAFRAAGSAYELLACPAERTLADRLAAGPALGAAATARIARGLLDALECLHAAQIFAGSIAPDQVLLTDTGEAVLAAGLTAPGAPASDDPYAAPEQSERHSERQLEGQPTSGAWTDIYRLSALLYHCLAAAPPPAAQARRSALQAGIADPLAPLSAAGRDPASEELRTLIGRGLELDLLVRPRSLRDWRARIARVELETGAGDGDVSSRDAMSRRGWAPVALAGTLLVAVLLGGLFLLSTARDRGPAPSVQSRTAAEAAAEAERWRQALEANAVVGYRAFIADFPDSPRVEQAQEYLVHLEEEAWPAVLLENTRAGFEAHLEVFPDGRHATEARARIEAFQAEEERAARLAADQARQDEQAWQQARAAGTIAALDGYLEERPAGRFAADARALRQQWQADRNDTARFEQAQQAHTIAAYRGYVSDFPSGRHVEEALQAIDSLTLRPGKTFRDCSGCPQMIVVPAGSFWQGSADASPLAVGLEKPRRRVEIAAPFAVGVREVTMRQWDACVAADACETQPGDNGWGRDRRPVILVSWNDAMQYAGWLSATTGQQYALPSESEWEYVARAGEESDWAGGSPDRVCTYGNIAGAETGFDWRHPDCSDRTEVSTAITGSFEPNAFGLYDVIGNVAEWTLDCMNLSYVEAPTDGSAWSRGLCSSRITRGGSWFSGSRDVRLPARFNLKAGDRNDFTGFRVVRRVEPQDDE